MNGYETRPFQYLQKLRGLIPAFILLFIGFGPIAGVNPDDPPGSPAVLISKAAEGSLSEVIQLIEDGSDINVRDELGRTALIMAASNGHEEIARFLINNGSNIKQKYGNRVVSGGASYSEKSVELQYVFLIRL